jgi:hypothetical protein
MIVMHAMSHASGKGMRMGMTAYGFVWKRPAPKMPCLSSLLAGKILIGDADKNCVPMLIQKQ